MLEPWSCQQTFLSRLEFVGLLKLHHLHQSCLSTISPDSYVADRSSNYLASLEMFVLLRLNNTLGLVSLIDLKVKTKIVKKRLCFSP